MAFRRIITIYSENKNKDFLKIKQVVKYRVFTLSLSMPGIFAEDACR
jgi:hypothetical protein